MISWFLRSGTEELVAEKNVEPTVLLPSATTKETLTVPMPLAPGEYEIEAQVDFHDGQPVQTIKRKVDIVSLSARQ